jgi:signal transduction histidine kinase
MLNRRPNFPLALERLLPWIVFAILLLYTYVELFQAPYIGFNFNPSTGKVQKIYVNLLASDLQVDDELYAVGSLLLSDWKSELRQLLFTDVEAGQILALQIRRAGQVEPIDWQVPGFNRHEFINRLFNNWWIGYIFWLAGLATLLLIRPKDTRYWLLTAFFLLTAVWLVAGNTSRWNLWGSAIVYRIAIWLFVPICLHLHWLFPQSLATLPLPLLWVGYLAAVLVAALQWFELVPVIAAVLTLALVLMSSFGLLIVHFLRQPEQRDKLKLLLYAFLFAVLPLVGLGIAALFGAIPRSGPIVLLALPVIPGAYFFSVYRYQLGAMELRANRLVALYLFLILLSTGIIILVAWMGVLSDFSGEPVSTNLAIGLLAALTGVFAFPSFVRFVEYRLFAIPLPPAGLLETYLARITTSLTKAGLVHLLKEEILPSLLIRQSALLHLRSRQELVYSDGIEEISLLPLPDLRAVFANTEIYRAATAPPQNQKILPWVHIGLPLRFEGEMIGVWLFGRHDPDDLYSQAEIATLQTLAHQTAIALMNIEQSELLQVLYQGSIDRNEVERTRLAHTLHDEVLNQIGLIYTSLDAACLSDQFVAAYQSIKNQLRQMIGNLRPAMLSFGLYAALEELATDLDDRYSHTTMVLLNIGISNPQARYPLRVEEYLFRIIQQACENSLQHAKAALIGIHGEMSSDFIDLSVEDDGIGFPLGEQANLSHVLAELLANKNFGLVGMYERAATIQAKLLIDSAPNQGTRVRVIWSADPGAVPSHAVSEEPD